jgi:pre-mRNA cleavage complex 2 protein Pcf11
LEQAVISPQPTESASVPIVPDNIANLLSTLLKAGVVSASGTPLGAGSTVTEIPTEPSKPIDQKQEAFRTYRNNILTETSLSNFDSIKSPHIVELLYDSQSLQCKQCGLRFSDTSLGKKNHNDHLDMHFRQNRKASEDTGRGHSRSWFIGIDDWIQEGEGKEEGLSHRLGRRNAKAAAVADNAKVEADLRAQYVIVPPGDEAQVVSCPICKETLKSEFLEDDEEWVWKNATRKDDRIYHATCHAEAITSTSGLAARLRSEKAHGSRSATPEVHPMAGILSGSRITPPPDLRISSSPPTPDSKMAGMKRKVENSDSNIPEEASGTPPAKKVVLSESLSTS